MSRTDGDRWLLRVAQTVAVAQVLKQYAPLEFARFQRWERTQVLGDGRIGSSDWPGFDRWCLPDPQQEEP